MGEQQGALSHRASLPQLVRFQQSPDDHFEEALRVGGNPTPTELPSAEDEDVEFAAYIMCSEYATLKNYRERALQAVKQLKHRWRPVTEHIRRSQSITVRRVTKDRDIGLVGLLIVQVQWPDTTYAFHLLEGFPAVGCAPWCGIFPQKPARPISREEVLEGGLQKAEEMIKRMGPGKDDEAITEATRVDTEKGWASEPMTWAEMRKATKGRAVRLIRRFAIEQASGKVRVIDDAADGGQSDTSEDANKLKLCGALQPARHAAVATEERGQATRTGPAREGVTPDRR